MNHQAFAAGLLDRAGLGTECMEGVVHFAAAQSRSRQLGMFVDAGNQGSRLLVDCSPVIFPLEVTVISTATATATARLHNQYRRYGDQHTENSDHDSPPATCYSKSGDYGSASFCSHRLAWASGHE